MSGYGDAFVVDPDGPDELLAQAGGILATGAGVVLVGGSVAVRPTPGCLIFEVLDPAPDSRRCENEYEVLIENAQRMVQASRLRRHLPGLPHRWLIVDNRGPDTLALWRAL